MSIQVSGVYGGGSKINGVKGEYLATANIAKGDFVQLTTKGVEEVAFTELRTINTYADTDNVSAAVLSPTQFILAYVEREKNSSVADSAIYAQVYTYSNGIWTAGIPLHIETIASAGGNAVIEVCRLTASRAAIVFLETYKINSRIFILDIDTNINVIASASDIQYLNKEGSSGTRLIPLTEDTFTMFCATGSSSNKAVYSWVIAYKDGAITANRITYSGETSSTNEYFYACKLNDQMVLLNVDNETYYQILTVANGTGTLIDTTFLTAGATTEYPDRVRVGELVQLSENRVLSVSRSKSISNSGVSPSSKPLCEYGILVYDPATSTLTLEGRVGAEGAKGAYYSLDAHKMSDTEIVVLTSDDDGALTATDGLYFVIVDTVTGNYSGRMLTPISGDGKREFFPITYAGYGWMIAFSGVTSVLIAPLVSQTTAAPYSTRLDGVATKGATAGQMAEVVTPRIEGTSDEIHVSYPVVS